MKQKYNIPDLQTKKRLVEVWEWADGREQSRGVSTDMIKKMLNGVIKASYTLQKRKLEEKFPFLSNEEDREVIKNAK